MRLSWMVVPLVLFTAPLRAMEMPTEIFEYVDNSRVVAFITESDLAKAPEWSPFEGAPPLGIADALKQVRLEIERESRFENASVLEIQLREVPAHVRQWHYMVKLETTVGDTPKFQYLVVLMNGQVIPAMKEPEALK